MGDPAAPPPPDPHAVWLARLPTALLVAVPLILVYGSLGSGEFLYGKDVAGHFYYMFAYVGRTMAGGSLPLWDPHTMAGFPLSAAMLAAVFYPFTWLSALLPASTFWSAVVALHLILSGVFCQAWLRRGLGAGPWAAFAGALGYLLSGPALQVVYAGHPSYVYALAWLPAVAWRSEALLARPGARNAALLAGALALLVLAGAVQYALFAALFLALRLAYAFAAEKLDRRAALLGFAGAAGGALLLAAPQLALTLELLPHTQRATDSRYEFITSHSLPPAKLLTFAAPGFFTDPVTRGGGKDYPQLEACGFASLGALALAAAALAGRAPRSLLWGSVCLLGVLLAMGRHSPVFTAAYHVIPGVDLFRAPVRYLALFALGAAPLVASGVDLLQKADARRALRWATWAMAAVLVLILLASFFADPVDGIAPRPPGDGGGPRLVAALAAAPPARRTVRDHRIGALLGAGLAAAVLAAVLAARGRDILGPRTSIAAIAGVAAVELLLFAAPHFRGVKAGPLEWPDQVAGFVKSRPGYPFRAVSPGHPDASDIGRCRVAGLEHLAGYEAMMLKRYTELMNAVHERPPDQMAVHLSPGRPHPALDMLGVRLWIVTPPARPQPSWAALGSLGGATMFENPGALPRAFMAAAAVALPSRDERLRVLADPAFDPRATVVVEDPADAAPSAGAPGEARLTGHGPGLYQVEADSPGGGWLVLAESYYPGWSAEVDGRAAPVVRANHVVQAVRLPPGRHRVEFRYRPRFLWLGLLAAAAGLALGAVALKRG